MLKKSFLGLMALILTLALILPAWALQGKVSAVDGSVVSLTVDDQMPSWVKKGVVAETSSGLAKVQAVEGRILDLKVKKSTAEALKVGDDLEVNPRSSEGGKKLQGC